jgi:hypothetical protein
LGYGAFLLKYLHKTGRLHKEAAATYRLPGVSTTGSSPTGPSVAGPAGASVEVPITGLDHNVTYPVFGVVRDLDPRAAAIDHAQVLVFLREHAERRWRPREIAAELGILDQDALTRLLKDLAAQGFLVKQSSGRYQYVPGQNAPAGATSGRAV